MNKLQPASPEKLYGLDHLRALAITLVFFGHFPSDKFPDKVLAIKNWGWIGVDLFFVLSGFLIARQLFREIKDRNKISLKTFFIKRFFRIIPVYLVVLTIYFLVPAFREREALAPLWKFLTFTQNIGLDPSVNGTFSHAWSLCVEEQFYLVFPLIILAVIYLKAAKNAAWLIMLFFAATCLLRLFVWNHTIQPLIAEENEAYYIKWIMWIYYPTYTRLDGLLTGISIAGIVTFYPGLANRIMKSGNITLLLGVILLCCSYFVSYDRSGFTANIFGLPLISIAFGLIVLAAISPSCILYKVRLHFTTWIATLSYAVYLVHKGITHLCIQYSGKLGFNKESYWLLLFSAIITLISALILRYTVEKPFLKLRDRLLAKRL